MDNPLKTLVKVGGCRGAAGWRSASPVLILTSVVIFACLDPERRKLSPDCER